MSTCLTMKYIPFAPNIHLVLHQQFAHHRSSLKTIRDSCLTGPVFTHSCKFKACFIVTCGEALLLSGTNTAPLNLLLAVEHENTHTIFHLHLSFSFCCSLKLICFTFLNISWFFSVVIFLFWPIIL